MAALVAACLAAAVVVAAWVMVAWDRRLRAADTEPDVGLSIMERVDDRPDTIGTWRPARRLDDGTMETPGTVEPDDAPAEDPVLAAIRRRWGLAVLRLPTPPLGTPVLRALPVLYAGRGVDLGAVT